MTEFHELKPNRKSFVKYSFFVRFIFSALFFLGLFYLSRIYFDLPAFYFLIAFLLSRILIYYYLKVAYGKRKYLIYNGKIICKSGGIFSDSETELNIRNITHVEMRLPFIRNKLFGTGIIFIESAGTSSAEIVFSDIDNPEKIYEYMVKIMKHNGFSLKKSKLIQKEKPSKLGAFFESLKGLFSFFVIAFVIVTSIMDDPNFSMIDVFSFNASLVFLILFLVAYFVYAVFHYLDLSRRVYEIYDDTIVYSEGFLNKNYSFIPIENLADSSLTQTLVDKIFNLYDVKISCQGTGNEIRFKNIVNGPKVTSNIDDLISKMDSLVVSGDKGKHSSEVKQKSLEYKSAPLRVDNDFTSEFEMDMMRSIIPLLILLPIFPIFIALFISQIIAVSCTKYKMKKRSIESDFNFLSRKNIEFTNDKIVTVILRENFIDKWFGTCSVDFWSIGSSENISFKNIKKTKDLYSNILDKSGISKQKIIYEMDSNFSFFRMLRANLPLTVFLLLSLIGSFFAGFIFSSWFLLGTVIIFLGYLIMFVYKSVYYNKSKLKFYKDFIYFRKGIFFVSHYYTLYDNIKDIITLKYPFDSCGSIKFNVSGEQVVQQGKNQGAISNSYSIRYIDNIETKDELIDIIFYQRPGKSHIAEIEKNAKEYSAKVILSSKPDLANSLFGLFLISIFTLTFVFLPITIPLMIWYVRSKSYSIEDYRIISRSGIFYKKQTSIVFSKIDHVNFRQGFLNKIFKNGGVVVNTIGSSRPEMLILNIKDFEKFYQTLKKFY